MFIFLFQQLPLEVLSEILKEVVLEDGDSAYLTLSLVCRLFRDVVTNYVFRKKTHFAWMDSKIYLVLWCKFSQLKIMVRYLYLNSHILSFMDFVFTF